MSKKPDPILIGMQDVQDALKKALIDKGEDYEYEKVPGEFPGYVVDSFVVGPHCVYFDEAASPSCLVGHVLSSLGVPPLPFNSLSNRSNVVTLMNDGVIAFEDWNPRLRYSRTMDLLDRAQGLQDDKVPWGTVVAQANEHIAKGGQCHLEEFAPYIAHEKETS